MSPLFFPTLTTDDSLFDNESTPVVESEINEKIEQRSDYWT